MNAREALRTLAALGVHATPVRRAGELKIPLPNTTKTVMVQHPRRRKDASQALEAAVRHWTDFLRGTKA